MLNELNAGRRHRLLDDSAPAELLKRLVDADLATLPRPGGGQTLARWQALCDVAAHDLSLVKLFEGHTDAVAVLQELGAEPPPAGSTWGLWAAEPPGARVLVHDPTEAQVRLSGRKCWCSGASSISHALLTAWHADGSGPQLVAVALDQPGVTVTDQGWHAVGMAGSASVDVHFDHAVGACVGGSGDYLARPGFWHGGAGIAACWHGGAIGLADALRHAVAEAGASATNPLRGIALGKVDVALQQTAALLREAAAWIDEHPRADACTVALRVRLAAEASARVVLDEVGRALGAAPFCRDARFARRAADLPVFVRQSGADRDFLSLGQRVAAAGAEPWIL